MVHRSPLNSTVDQTFRSGCLGIKGKIFTFGGCDLTRRAADRDEGGTGPQKSKKRQALGDTTPS